LIHRWATSVNGLHKTKVRSALLVAPSDVDADSYPAGTKNFQPMPLEVLPFLSIVVASSNDEYVTLERAKFFATSWGSEFVNIGAAGHINSASELGDWPQGIKLLQDLINNEQKND
jgi:predicted alpha/beta hydrolase family esterase